MQARNLKTLKWVTVLAVFAWLPLPTTAQQRLPAPESASQQKAVERIQGVFPDEYKSTNRDVKAKLAKQLLELGRVEKDAVARFALYREAVRLASENGDTATAMQAIDAMEAAYKIDPAAVTAYALGNLSKSVGGNEDSEAFAQQCQRFAAVLIDENRFDEAKTILGYGYNAVRRIRGSKLALALRETGEQIDSIAKDFKKVEAHAETLKTNPDDPAANLEVGRFECFVKGNWKSGLGHLAKGSDATLKRLAAETLAQPAEAQEKYKLASAWWKQGEALGGVTQQRVQGYASRIYSDALPELTGLSKVTAEKRIAEVAPSAETGGVAARGPKTINMLQLIDPDEDFKPKDKWQLAGGALACTDGNFVPKVVFPYQPPEEYDVTYVFAQPRLRNGVGVIMPNPDGKSSFAFFVGGAGGRAIALSNDQNKYRKEFPSAVIHAGVKYSVVVKVRKEGVQALVNGTLVANVPTDFSDLKVGPWHRINDVNKLAICCDDKTVFYGVQVTEVTGEGAMTRFPKE